MLILHMLQAGGSDFLLLLQKPLAPSFRLMTLYDCPSGMNRSITYGVFDPSSIINAPRLAQVKKKMQEMKYTRCCNLHIPPHTMAELN